MEPPSCSLAEPGHTKGFLVPVVHCGALPPGPVSVLHKSSDVFAMRPIIQVLMCSVIRLPLLPPGPQNTEHRLRPTDHLAGDTETQTGACAVG